MLFTSGVSIFGAVLYRVSAESLGSMQLKRALVEAGFTTDIGPHVNQLGVMLQLEQ